MSLIKFRFETEKNLTKLIAFLTILPANKPKESELTIESLKAKPEALKIVNRTSNTADAKAEAARLHRNIVLYTDKTGLNSSDGIHLNPFGTMLPAPAVMSPRGNW